MDRLLGYDLRDELFRGRRTLIYRAVHPADESRAVLKVIRDARPSRERVLWFRREHELLQLLADVPGVVRPLAMGHDAGRWTLAMEDVGGSSLAELVSRRPMGVEEFLPVAIRAADALAGVHARDILHKDISPANIVLNRGTCEVRLIDFGIATRLSRQAVGFSAAGALEGTLAYISPEQTGRMNRAIDARTDLYSLGATFHHLLSGAPPFAGRDPVALVHAHLARPAPRLDHVPPGLADVIQRLLAKDPEDRYQSAAGLRDDLQECARRLADGAIASFPLEARRTPSRLRLPDRLYGREAETADLLAAFDRAADGGTEWLLVTGRSGIGKSALVHEVHRPITARRGFFVAGKFDQLQRDVPYAVVVQALEDLAAQVLTAPERQLTRWREALNATLGSNGGVLTDVIPALEAVMGPQPTPPALGGAESRIRLRAAFASLVRVFAAAEHPLTIFLDDLQWVDAASLDLIEHLLTDADLGWLLVVGAYRDDEVDAGAPLLLAADSVRDAGVPVTTIEVGPLDSVAVATLVGDAVGRPATECGDLASALLAKTAGNPFFLRAFLRELWEAGELRPDPHGGWVWDTSAIQARPAADNVVALVLARLRSLGADAQEVLGTAGLLGAAFDLADLAAALDRDAAEVWKTLAPPIRGGFVVPLGEGAKLTGLELDEGLDGIRLRFTHDRVQEAACGLLEAADRTAAEWTLGRRLLGRGDGDRLFDVVGHLNAGLTDAASRQERDELAELNLAAARRAHGSAAFATAYAHATRALTVLGDDGPARRYDLVRPLHDLCVETAFQTAAYDDMEAWVARAEAAAHNVLDLAWIHEIKTESFNGRGLPLEALAYALDVLEGYGVSLPREPGYDEVVAEMTRAGELLAGTSPQALVAAPDMTDPAVRAAVGLMCKVYSSAYVASPFAFAVLTLRQFQLVVEHGNCAISALAYAVYGLLLAGLANDVETAYTFGALSQQMLDRPDIKRFEAQARHLFSCHTRFWKEHVRASADGERAAWRVGHDTGEMEFGAYGGHVGTKYALFHGHDLPSLRREAAQYTAGMQRARQGMPLNSHRPWHQAIINLTEPTPDPSRLAGEILDAATARPELEAVNDRMAVSNALTAELLLSVLFEDFDRALAVGTDGAAYLDAVLSQFNQPLHIFLDALARAEAWHGADEDARGDLREGLDGAIGALEPWAAAAPVNFAQKLQLLRAVRAEQEGDVGARDGFDAAIESSRAHDFVLDEVITLEAAARFLERTGRAAAARHYRTDAHEVCVRWGATAKTALMEAADPTLRSTAIAPTITATRTATMATVGSELDVQALLRAANAISSEVVLKSLLERLLETVLEASGATRAVVVLADGDALTVEAVGQIDGPPEVLQELPLPAAASADAPLPMSVLNLVLRTRRPVVLDDAGTAPRFARDPYLAARSSRSVLCVPLLRERQSRGAIYVENERAVGVFTPDRADLLRLLAGQIAVAIDNARLYAHLEDRVAERTAQLEARNTFIRQVFGRYLSDDVVDTLLESSAALSLGGERRVVTLMFTDLRGFTAMCERLSPEAALRTVNNHLEVVTEIAQRHHGTINNIVGDGLFLLFGAPILRTDDADRALLCALEMQHAMARVNARNRDEGLPQLSMGVGIHTGEVVVGNIGSETRAKYSVIGRNANLAARLEAMASGGQIMVSDATLEAATLSLAVRSKRTIQPKGVSSTIDAFELAGAAGHAIWDRPDLADETRRVLDEPVRTVLRRVVGKQVVEPRVPALVREAGAQSLLLELSSPLTLGTDIALGGAGGLLYAKVSEVEGGTVVRITGGTLDVLGL